MFKRASDFLLPKGICCRDIKKYNVPQEKWDTIASDLALKDKQVIKTVEEKAKNEPEPT